MAGTTHEVLTTPAAGTQVAPIHNYSDEQEVQLQALREVSQGLDFLRFGFSYT